MKMASEKNAIEIILVDSWLLIKIVVTFRAALLNAKKCANVYNVFIYILGSKISLISTIFK